MDNANIAGNGNAGRDRIEHHGGIHAGRDVIADRGGHIAGGDLAVSPPGNTREDIQQLRQEIERLSQAIAGLRLTRAEHRAIENEVEALRDLAAAENPNRQKTGKHLRRLIEVLTTAGTIADAGDKLTGPISSICRLLGKTGGSILTILP